MHVRTGVAVRGVSVGGDMATYAMASGAGAARSNPEGAARARPGGVSAATFPFGYDDSTSRARQNPRARVGSIGVGYEYAQTANDDVHTTIPDMDPELGHDPGAARARIINQTINVSIVTVALCVTLNGFFNQPLFLGAMQELFASPAFAKVSAAFGALPLANWEALEAALHAHPWRMASIITGVAYAVGDWLAQCSEGGGIFQFDRTRLAQCTFIGAVLLAPMAHVYYNWQGTLISASVALWISAPVKIVVDQILYAPIYNMLFFILTGVLRRDTKHEIFGDLMPKLWRTTLASWKIWPFVHIITYTVIPTRFQLMWVDALEVLWVAYLSMVANEQEKKEKDAAAAAAATAAAATATAAAVAAAAVEYTTASETTKSMMEDAWNVNPVGV